MKKLSVEIWSDIACPWCHVGKRRLEAALARFPHGRDVDIVWRAFELDPSAPRVQPASSGTYAERLARKYGSSVSQAAQQIASMTATAAQDGLDFRFDRIRPGNTFDAHRVLHLALDRGKQDAVKERFLRGYLSDGEPIGEPEALARMAGEAGLDVDEVRGVLASDAYAREVRADEARAQAHGISGVPFFILGGKYALSGAQPAALFEQALAKAWAECAEEKLETFAEGAVCGPEGCA
jgi:predicted DsbA family dithiol-disulfide isomerase